MAFDVPIEIDILLSCARPQITPERAATIREALQNGIDWEYLFRVARRHGLVSLLYYQLNTICPESVPAALSNKLKARLYANLAPNLFLTAELLKLLGLFQNHGIPAVPFKGPVLASSVYGNLSLREFSDLDILIHREDLNKAKDLLLCHDYLPISARNRILYCYFLMIPRRFGDFMFLKLPSSLFFLYYLIRPLRLLGKYSVGRLIHSLFGQKFHAHQPSPLPNGERAE